MGRRRLIVAAIALLAGCGPTPPQAPGPQAHQLNVALSGLSEACGHAAEIEAFSHDPRELTPIERQAQSQIPALVRIYRQNRAWIFQGETVSELVRMSIAYLDRCGLHRAARRLRAAGSER